MYRVLLTGFTPFGEFRSNPTQTIVEQFNAGLSGVAVYCCVLPVNFRTVPAYYQRVLQSVKPHFILNLGLAGGSGVIQPEKAAFNIGYDRQNTGSFTLIAQAPDAYFTALPVEELATALSHRQLPAVASYYAGSYLCNMLYFQSLHWCSYLRHSRALFMHLPLHTEAAAQACMQERKAYASLPLPMLQEAVVYTIEWGVAYVKSDE
ncbi:MAG TPA: hypothetical protein PK239_11615 [Chitinophagales bacterium]|nr:hypothetical protein [Chitinophagales bacterium]HRK27917.1 hypothetical protein [Chitinophagales bacterium]